MKGWWSAVSETGRTLETLFGSALLPFAALLVVCTWTPWVCLKVALREGAFGLEFTVRDVFATARAIAEAVIAPFAVLLALCVWMPLWRLGLIEEETEWSESKLPQLAVTAPSQEELPRAA